MNVDLFLSAIREGKSDLEAYPKRLTGFFL